MSQEFGVTREMIAAVLYREITFFNWADATDNIRLKIGISGDASIGLGQILIATGRRTEIDITGSSNYTDDEMRNRLLNDTINIRYVAIVLKSEAKALGISDVMSISRANASKVFARYNAGPYYESPDGVRYGTQTLQYGDAFWRFYQDTDLYK